MTYGFPVYRSDTLSEWIERLLKAGVDQDVALRRAAIIMEAIESREADQRRKIDAETASYRRGREEALREVRTLLANQPRRHWPRSIAILA